MSKHIRLRGGHVRRHRSDAREAGSAPLMAWPKGRPRPPDTCARMSEARKRALADRSCPPAQRRYYAKLRPCGFSRDAALATCRAALPKAEK